MVKSTIVKGHAPLTKIEEVHLIFKSHLDIGFTNFAEKVIEQYFSIHIPAAVKTADQLRASYKSERLVWTTGAWLIYEYLERSSPCKRRQLEAAIESGDIVWHVMPFTTHSELADASLFRFGLSLSQTLDKRFGKKTISAKLTDVPGHTRAIVPLLAEAGVKLLHVGVNPASKPPNVPNIFVWRHENADVIMIYDKGDYGQTLVIPQIGSALSFLHKGDNASVPGIKEIVEVFEQKRHEFPDATIKAACLDDFARKLLPIKDTLPVITHEIGDTWIHGAGSDPEKIAQFRQLCRLRTQWLKQRPCLKQNARLTNFSKNLLMIAEHTWGMDEKTHLVDFNNYEKKALQCLRQTAKCKRFEQSWEEQRSYISKAVESLGATRLAKEAKHVLKEIIPAKPDNSGFIKIIDKSVRHECEYFDIGFDPSSGAIDYLKCRATGRLWASRHNNLGGFFYQTFSQANYDKFWQNYVVNKNKVKHWALADFTKPGIDEVGQSVLWRPELLNIYKRQDAAGVYFILEMNMSLRSSRVFGAPGKLFMEISVPKILHTINFRLQWFEKAACRLPEAMWLAFCPKFDTNGSWLMDKMGVEISPLDVVKNGNRHLHGIGTGITYRDERNVLEIQSLDAPLVAPGEPSLLNFNNNQPTLSRGMHFNLFNNVWGTNFPMWYEKNALFRFRLIFK